PSPRQVGRVRWPRRQVELRISSSLPERASAARPGSMRDDHGAPRRQTQRLLRRVTYGATSPELERAVLERAKAQGHDVAGIILIHPPRFPCPLFGQQMLRPLDIA